MSLFKFYTSEGGTRVPLIVSGPGVRPAATSHAFSIISDITPTLLDYAGVKAAPPPAAFPVQRGRGSPLRCGGPGREH